MEKRKEAFSELIELMSRLRSKSGCPWDREQTHKTLLPYLIEESYEVLDTIEACDDDKLKEELGDLLLQIVFHAQIAKERRKFDVHAVIKHLVEKLKTRHPHVFGRKRGATKEEVLRNWEHIKLRTDRGENKTVLSGIPRHLPALLKAYRVQEKVARFDFDWKNALEVFTKIEEEIDELKKALLRKKKNSEEIEDEVGDILFSWVNLSRHLNVNPEFALRRTTDKFIRRFGYVEEELKKRKVPLKEANLTLLDSLWEEAKHHRVR
jgi:tetrapyrrole methylase family protein/MazG family protein